MTKKRAFLLSFFLISCLSGAQDTILPLAEVRISDRQLRAFSRSKNMIVLNDSILKENQSSLTSLLNFNSTVYFKEQGYGMVSSPSFRGTTAQQTAVVWNGININSQLNGQTDFNTVLSDGFGSVTVRPGGGSVVYGSSAVGGTVHLDNELRFGKAEKAELRTEYGSFNTLGLKYGVAVSNATWSGTFSVSRNRSDNDYKWFTGGKNENGQFYNTGINAAIGYKIGEKQQVTVYGQLFDGERHFSLINPSDSRTKYKDFNTRSMVEWALYGRWTAKVRTAYLTEKYEYYPEIASESHTFGTVRTLIAKADISYDVSDRMALNALADVTRSRGDGSDIRREARTVGSGAVLLRHRPVRRWEYEIGARTEVTDAYGSPFLFSAGNRLQITDNYRLKANVSRNFRIPTFNDLYWTGAGNTELHPETALQYDIGNEWQGKGYRFTLTGFQGKIRDMIRWVPSSGGIFRPENVDRVETRGVEVTGHYETALGKHRLAFDGTYSYTESKNEATGRQLIYVPYHKATASVGYGWKAYRLTLQHLFTGEIYMQSDNDPNRILDAYNVTNLLASAKIGTHLDLGVRVNNLFDSRYASVEGRPMPLRHYSMNITLIY